MRQHTTLEIYRDFFRSAGQRTDIPQRSGYYVGFRVAQRLAQEMSLTDMVMLRGDDLLHAVDRALADLGGAEAAGGL